MLHFLCCVHDTPITEYNAYGHTHPRRDARPIFETALCETIHHHARCMARPAEEPGWTSQCREIVLSISADLHDLRGTEPANLALDPDSHVASQGLAMILKAADSDGVVYPSIRHPGGQCVGLFYPDGA